MAFELQNNGWIGVPWTEFVGKDGSHGTSFSSGWDDGNQATFNIIVNWDDGPQAEEDILGISVFLPEPAPGVLSRTPPVQHPWKPWLRAERIISAHPAKWTGKEFVTLPYGPGAGGNEGALSEYAFWMLSIGFTTPKYTIITDSDLAATFGGQEWNRWCEIKETRRQETITREGGAFIWQAGPLAGPPAQTFNAPVGQHFYSSILEVLWRRVPRVGLYGSDGDSDLLIDNIRNNVGYVHNGTTEMWGIGVAAGNANANGSALRFLPPEVVSIASPFSPETQGLPWGRPNTYHDVKFRFHIWNPPSGDGVNYGHNLGPSPQPDGNWYLVKTASGATVYPVADLSAVFQLATD